ncbi:MAG: DUF4124 domain-containing protein [Desulfobacterales bacterium]|nr:DUF4124 domain-containing protein [Desulfobacterales bacterium]
MKGLIILEMILMSFIWSPIATANIYTWTDENNVRHFTNQVPPAGAEIFVRVLQIEPATTRKVLDNIDINDSAAENQELKDRLSDSQEKLSETLEKVNALEDKIRNENDGDLPAIEPKENLDSESVDNPSYSESEDTPKRNTYYYPAGIIHNGHFEKKSHYQSRRSHHRSHKNRYYYRKHKNGGHYNSKRYYKKHPHKKHYLRNYRYKNPDYRKQHFRNHFSGSVHKQPRRLGIHQNRRNLEHK